VSTAVEHGWFRKMLVNVNMITALECAGTIPRRVWLLSAKADCRPKLKSPVRPGGGGEYVSQLHFIGGISSSGQRADIGIACGPQNEFDFSKYACGPFLQGAPVPLSYVFHGLPKSQVDRGAAGKAAQVVKPSLGGRIHDFFFIAEAIISRSQGALASLAIARTVTD
jgi:hypothetical protein